MTKTPSIKTALLEQYLNLNLHEIETELQQLLNQSPSSETKNSIHAARQALQKRQHYIKSQAMQFEATNDHHLLVFDSTDNFGKIAGRSVLFYALTIADRIHRRYNIKNDTDNYSRSDEGIISIRVLSQLEAQLHEIGIFPDHDLNTPELHFTNSPKPTARNKSPNFATNPAKTSPALLPSLSLNPLPRNSIIYFSP